MNPNESFWIIPESETKFELPRALIRQQAAALANITNGLLDGGFSQQSLPNGTIVDILSMRVPRLGYSMTILRVTSTLLQPYPVIVEDLINDEVHQKVSQEGYSGVIRHILSSEKMQKIIIALKAQAEA